MPKQIPLTEDTVALVDDAEYERVARYKWTLDSNGYVVRKQTVARRQYRKQMLHRFLMQPPDGMDVDHADGDPLNNTRANLRICTRSQNCANRGPAPGSSSRFKGVYYRRDRDCWRALITVDGEKIHLGHFDSQVEAARAYDRAARQHFSEFAWLNFPNASHEQNAAIPA